MRLLLFADLHCNLEVAADLVSRSAEVDVVVGGGDYARVRRGLDKTIRALSVIDKPVVLVSGNNETLDELRAACRHWPSAHVLHGDGVGLDGIEFFGLGGGVPVTPFGDWSFDLTEEEADRLLASCPDGAVLVSHSPPHGALDHDEGGRHLGSTALRSAIERTRPRLVVCGHIHGTAGQEAVVHGCRVINPGPAGMVLEV